MGKSTGGMAGGGEALTAHLKGRAQGSRGTENVGADDILIPRLSLLQALAPQFDATEHNYIEGAAAGDIVNSLTGENHGKEVTIIPVFFRKEFVIWKDRKKGGGLFGIHRTRKEAVMALPTLDPPVEDYDIMDTAQQFCMVVNADGSLTEALLTMSRTKMSVSRKLQSLIRLAGHDSFACQYKLSVVSAQSDSGKYFNFAVTPAGYAAEEHYHAAEVCYESIVANESRYVAHRDGADGGVSRLLVTTHAGSAYKQATTTTGDRE